MIARLRRLLLGTPYTGPSWPWRLVAKIVEEPALQYPEGHALHGKSKIARISRYPEADLERLTIRRAQLIVMPRRERQG